MTELTSGRAKTAGVPAGGQTVRRNKRGGDADEPTSPPTALLAVAIDPTVEVTYWRENFTKQPYAKGASFDDYGPAYGYGVNSYTKYPGRSFADVESDLSRDWNTSRGKSKLDWANARVASRDAWERLSDSVERAVPGDSDRDGK